MTSEARLMTVIALYVLELFRLQIKIHTQDLQEENPAKKLYYHKFQLKNLKILKDSPAPNLEVKLPQSLSVKLI